MIVKLDYADYKPSSGLAVLVNGKSLSARQVVCVNQGNIAAAMEHTKSNSAVVALDFLAGAFLPDMEFLKSIGSFNKPILYKLDLSATPLDTLTCEYLTEHCILCPSSVRLILKMPKDHCDMRAVLTISQRFSNVRFCGGHYLLHDKGNFGCITQQDMHGTAQKGKGLVVQGCSSPYEIVSLDEVTASYTELVEKERKVSTGTKQKAKPQATTLFTMSKSGLGAF